MSLHELLASAERTLAPVRHVTTPILSDPVVVGVWALLVVASVAVLWWDLHERNRALPSMMTGVWTLVVLYSGPLGLAVYWCAGRTQIGHDSLWRRGFRSTARCYSGCGAGEVVGFAVLAGLLALQRTLVVTAGTFALAFSPSVGFAFAFPVNVTLVHLGGKEGMQNPAEMSRDGGRATTA